jgi:hypothetical protein
MDTNQAPADDPEMQWIAKYRKALDQAAIQGKAARGAKVRDAMMRTCGVASSWCCKIFRNALGRWIGPGAVRPNGIIKSGIAAVQKLEVSPLAAKGDPKETMRIKTPVRLPLQSR